MCWRRTCPKRGWTWASTCCWQSWRRTCEQSRAFARVVVLQSGRRLIMDFRPLNDTERQQLITALRGNADNDLAILTDRRDTSFAGTTDEVTDDEVITAIRSVPCHY